MSTPADMPPHRAQWNSQLGFLLAAIGSAVGLGNIWKFPYLCYKNGGGAFLIPYAVALLTVGIPVLVLEFGLGHQMRGSAPMSFAKINRNWEWLGWWMVMFVMFGIVMYYCVVIAWCVCYLGFSVTQAWGADPNSFFFQKFLGYTGSPQAVGDVRSPILLTLIIVWVVNWLIVYFGVDRGIERANKVMMPLLVVLLLGLVGWTWTLPGAWSGLVYYLKPNFARLGDPRVWIDAYSQVCFSLSIGFGIMIAYASYLPKKADINFNALMTGLADSAVAFTAGLAVFGTLGYMSATTGKPFDQVVQNGIGLAFVAYPQAVGLIPHLRGLFGVVFFLVLIFAGITSSISIIEAFTSAMVDKFHYSRKRLVTVLCVLGFLGGIIFTTGGGLAWLDIVDHVLSQYGLFIACLLQCLVIGWRGHLRPLREHVDAVSSIRVGVVFEWMIRFVVPAVLLVLIGSGLSADLAKPYEGYSWMAIVLIGRDWLLATLVTALFVAMRPWRRPLH
jgi:NSS family neurotransmitter:Na+ symporter